ncbi:MAG: hypothetical protein Q8903_08420 [Bacteroidota bacterium]|nr:hypothetical protein [Bacteroidota bacterium]
MKSVLFIMLLLYTITLAQIKKQLEYSDECNLHFDNFNLLYFNDENNKQYYVISTKAIVDSLKFNKYIMLTKKCKYNLDLIKVNFNKILFLDLRCYLKTGTTVVSSKNLDTTKINIKDYESIYNKKDSIELYYSPSLIDHYYINCHK